MAYGVPVRPYAEGGRQGQPALQSDCHTRITLRTPPKLLAVIPNALQIHCVRVGFAELLLGIEMWPASNEVEVSCRSVIATIAFAFGAHVSGDCVYFTARINRKIPL